MTQKHKEFIERLKKERLDHLKEESAKRVERVVCSGGGAKGVVYPGSYKAMVDTGVFAGVKEVAGASAGAITAALMAFGMPPNDLRKVLLETNFPDLMGERIGNLIESNRPGVAFLTKDGKPLYDYIRSNIIASLRSTLWGLEGRSSLTEIYKKLDGPHPVITFRDLALLNQEFPEHFKQLVLPAVKFPNGEVQIFNATLTPDVEIALACRASSSIPVILEPVDILINGQMHTFVDGGVFDNLPTDYFDKDENNNFIPNTKPTQTLVFAFGEGLKNENNQIFQALYGQQWDAVVNDQTLETILKHAINTANKIMDSQDEVNTIENRINLLAYSFKLVLHELVKAEKMTKEQAKVIGNAMTKGIKHLVENPKNHQNIWKASHEENQNPFTKLALFLKEQMKVILYKADVFEKLKRDVLIEVFGDFNAPYKNTAQKELGFQKLRSQYALRTVELRVGDIKTTDFKEATKVARVMDALGYLDTLNHITNHELQDETFDEKAYFDELVDNFEKIYKAVIEASGKDSSENHLTRDMEALKTAMLGGKNQKIDKRQIYQLIKDKVESKMDSTAAFALSRAVEYQNKLLSANELFKETYEEGFKRSGLASVSKITGESIFSAATLHKQLKDKNMFDLYENQGKKEQKTRTDKVYDALSAMKGFSKDNDLKPELIYSKAII